MVEGLLDHKQRVCIIDPTGAWNGLRSSASGKRVGYPVVIFGGAHQDLELGYQTGEVIAETIGTTSTPSILDTSLMKIKARTIFMAEFADALIRKNKGPLHLIMDEAHLFAPQGKVNSPQAGEMLSAVNNLVSLGRSRGLRIVLITQRPAKLHKDSLSQCETLVAMRLIAPQDRNAVREWIEDNADKDQGQEIISSLATLKTGQGWVWAPELGILNRITFPHIKTFDSGAAPSGKQSKKHVWAPIDMDAIRDKLKSISVEVVANEPSVLKQRIAALEKELKNRPAVKEAVATSKADLIDAEHRGWEKGWKQYGDADRKNRTALEKFIIDSVKQAFIEISKSSVSVPPKHDLREIKSSERWQSPATKAIDASRAEKVRLSITQAIAGLIPKASGQSVNLPKGEAAILTACIQYDPEGRTREQLTVITGFKRSTRDAYIYRLAEKGYLDLSGDKVTATQEGINALPNVAPLPTGEELQQFWLNKLPQGERKILEELIEAYPEALTRDELTESTGFKRSTRDAYIYRMLSKKVVTEPERGTVKASEDLF